MTRLSDYAKTRITVQTSTFKFLRFREVSRVEYRELRYSKILFFLYRDSSEFASENQHAIELPLRTRNAHKSSSQILRESG